MLKLEKSLAPAAAAPAVTPKNTTTIKIIINFITPPARE
jgi:hypothetical protein